MMWIGKEWLRMVVDVTNSGRNVEAVMKYHSRFASLKGRGWTGERAGGGGAQRLL